MHVIIRARMVEDLMHHQPGDAEDKAALRTGQQLSANAEKRKNDILKHIGKKHQYNDNHHPVRFYARPGSSLAVRQQPCKKAIFSIL